MEYVKRIIEIEISDLTKELKEIPEDNSYFDEVWVKRKELKDALLILFGVGRSKREITEENFKDILQKNVKIINDSEAVEDLDVTLEITKYTVDNYEIKKY